MFGSSKPVVFDPYGRRRKRRWLPRWLVLLLVGAALGVAGVMVVQERYLPPRLSSSASAQLRSDYAAAEAERLRLKDELAAATKRLDAALAEQRSRADELAAGRSAAAQARDELAAVVAALPADPRGGSVEVRAARFAAKPNALGYDLVLTHSGSRPLAAVLQLVLAGDSARGAPLTINAEPVPVSINTQAVLRGSAALPAGFTPRQATVQVLDRPGGKLLGMRVMWVK